MDVVKFAEAEVANPADFEKISTAARDGVDDVSVGGLGWPAHYSHCRVETTAAPNVIKVMPGEHHGSGIVYRAEAEIEVDLQAYKPIVATDKIWIAILLSGQIEEVIENRAYKTGSETLNESVVVSQPTPVVEKRMVRVSPVQGVPGPVPVKPVIAGGLCCVAYVLLDTTGVVSIEANDAARVKTVYEIEQRLSIVEVDLTSLGSITQTLQTDLAGVAAQVEQGPEMWLVEQTVRDVAMTRALLNLPDTARNYFHNNGLVPDFWDFEHADSLFRVKNGIRFQYEAVHTAQLRLADLNNPAMMSYGNHHLPAHDVVRREVVPKGSASENISNAVHTIRTARQVTVSHTSVSYGETVRVCENMSGWGALAKRQPGETFAVNGQEFKTSGQSDIDWNKNPDSVGHKNYDVQRVLRQRWTSSYTVYDTKEVGLSGAIYYQTHPSSQLSICLGYALYFNRVGTEEDVTLLAAGVQPTGTPDFDWVIETSTVAVDDLTTGWVDFAMMPWLREPGKQYAWYTHTAGNHEIAKTTNNSFPHGTAGKSLDGIWAQGSIMEDYSFQELVARFRNNRTVAEFETISLAGGMTELQLVYQSLEAGQSRIVWEIKADGMDEFILIDGREDNALANLPPAIRLRATFVGTPDIAPIMVLDANAVCIVGRMHSTMRAVSKLLAFEVPTDTFQIIVNMDAFDAARHTCTPKIILPDNSIVLADSITATQDPSKPTRTKFVANFTLGAEVMGARMRIDATTDSKTSVPFVQDAQINAF